MCGRYNLTNSPQTQALLDDLGIDPAQVPIRFNIAPTDKAVNNSRNKEPIRVVGDIEKIN